MLNDRCQKGKSHDSKINQTHIILFVLLFDYAIYLLNSQVVGILFKFIQFTYVSLIVQKFHFQQLMFALNLLSRKSVLDS